MKTLKSGYRREGRYEKKYKSHRAPKARRYRFGQKKYTSKKRNR